MEAKHVFGITDEIWNTAAEIMKGFKEFPKFLALLEEETHSASLDENHQFWPGSWLSVKNYQEKITQKSRQDTEDSQETRYIAGRCFSYTRFRHTAVSPFIAPETGQKGAPDDPQGFREESDPGIARDKTQFPDAEDEALINTYMVILLEQSSRIPNHQLAE